MISIIAAITKNHALGKNNKLLYQIPEDFKRMQKLTTGHPIIMGRKTFESIGKVLPRRTNIIITSRKGYQIPSATITHSLEEAIEEAKKSVGADEIFIFGGASIYRESLDKNLVDKIYLTVIDEEVKGDVFFPKLKEHEWDLIREKKRVVKVNDKEIKYFFKTYKKNITTLIY